MADAPKPRGLRSASTELDEGAVRRNIEDAIRGWLDALTGDPLQRAEFMGYIAELAGSEAARVLYDLRYPNVGAREAAEHGDVFDDG